MIISECPDPTPHKYDWPRKKKTKECVWGSQREDYVSWSWIAEWVCGCTSNEHKQKAFVWLEERWWIFFKKMKKMMYQTKAMVSAEVEMWAKDDEQSAYFSSSVWLFIIFVDVLFRRRQKKQKMHPLRSSRRSVTTVTLSWCWEFSAFSATDNSGPFRWGVTLSKMCCRSNQQIT